MGEKGYTSKDICKYHQYDSFLSANFKIKVNKMPMSEPSLVSMMIDAKSATELISFDEFDLRTNEIRLSLYFSMKYTFSAALLHIT